MYNKAFLPACTGEQREGKENQEDKDE